MKTCPECKGTGRLEAPEAYTLKRMIMNALEYPKPCTLCDETGSLPDKVEKSSNFWGYRMEIACSYCGCKYRYRSGQPHHQAYCGTCGTRL